MTALIAEGLSFPPVLKPLVCRKKRATPLHRGAPAPWRYSRLWLFNAAFAGSFILWAPRRYRLECQKRERGLCRIKTTLEGEYSDRVCSWLDLMVRVNGWWWFMDLLGNLNSQFPHSSNHEPLLSLLQHYSNVGLNLLRCRLSHPFTLILTAHCLNYGCMYQSKYW